MSEQLSRLPKTLVLRDRLAGIPSEPGPEREHALQEFYERKNKHVIDVRPIFSSQEASIGADTSFLTDLHRRRLKAVSRTLQFLSETDQKKHFALIDMVAFKEHRRATGRLSLSEINAMFDERVGSILIPRAIYESNDNQPDNITKSRQALDKFFNHTSIRRDAVSGKDIIIADRVFDSGEVIELRGENYFVAQDKDNLNFEQKFEIILQDLTDGIQTLSQTNRTEIDNQRDYLLYLGLLDYLKNHSLIIYHAISYFERLELTRLTKLNPNYKKDQRNGESELSKSVAEPEIPLKNPDELSRYKSNKDWAFHFSKNFTNLFYQALMGIDHGTTQYLPADQSAIFQGLVDYIKKEGELTNSLENRLRYPEANHPLVIALGAREASLNNPKTDFIIGIPTGGTESSIVTQMMFKINNPEKKIFLLEIPVSIHTELFPSPSSDAVVKLLEELEPDLLKEEGTDNLKLKNILLIDDNSESGRTLSIICKALRKIQVKDIKVHIAEFNTRKIKNLRTKTNSQTFFNSESSPSTIGVHSVGENDQPVYAAAIQERKNGGINH